MPKWFSRKELDVLDDLTANNKAVLASLGGRPDMGRDEEDENAREEEGMDSERGVEDGVDSRRRRSRSAVRQRAGSITRQTLHNNTSRQGED